MVKNTDTIEEAKVRETIVRGFYGRRYNLYVFFFSSRRRHTRLTCDWSSDVCSSDLGGSCLTQPGDLLTVSGMQASALEDTSLGLNAKIAASTATFRTADNIAIRVGGNPGLCFSGGGVIGALPPATPWERMHRTYGLVPYARAFRLEKLRVFDYGLGISMDAPEDADWTLRDVYLSYIRDDCVENGFLNSGTIENSLLDGCYEAFSSRPYTTPTPDGSNNLFVVRNSLVRLQDMDQGYLRPGHGGFFK